MLRRNLRFLIAFAGSTYGIRSSVDHPTALHRPPRHRSRTAELSVFGAYPIVSADYGGTQNSGVTFGADYS